MTAQRDSPTRPLIAGTGIVAIGVLVAIVTVLGLNLLGFVLLAFAFGGIIALLPGFLVRDPRAYWLFLLVLSIPFDIHKRVTSWAVDPFLLLRQYGPTASGTISLDIFLTDAVLLAMLLPWLAELCLKRERFYFPNVGYLFVFYLVLALIVSLAEAESLYLAICEFCRQVLYFLSFVYLINNVVTRTQLRAIVFALFIGLGIVSGTVIAFFALGIGTETNVFSGLYGDHEGKSTLAATYRYSTMYTTLGKQSSTVNESTTKRSAGIFTHPAISASFVGLTAPLALAFLTVAQCYRDRILFGAFIASGFLASFLTFSRAGLVGLVVGSMVSFVIGRWSGLVSRQAFRMCVFIFASVAVVSLPLLVTFLELRPGSITRRLEFIELNLDSYWQRPILGTGLNNGSIAIQEGAQALKDSPNSAAGLGAIPSHYLVVLIETGLVGFVLFFAFFGKIVIIAFRSMRAVETEMKVLLAGVVGGLSSLAIQNLADNAFGGHAINALLWLFAGMTVAIARRAGLDRVRSTPGRVAPSLRLPLAAASGPGDP